MNKPLLDFIMLVDDDDATNFINKIILKKAGFKGEIVTKINGLLAMEYLTDPDIKKPDLILLDINMPVMDGWEFIDAYQSLKEEVKKSITIVMLTTSLNPRDKERAENLPIINLFKHKPLTVDDAKEIVSR